MAELIKQLEGWRLTTAEIIYRLPDHPSLLQTFVWQKLDAAPRFPALHAFLGFWEREIEAQIHSVRVAQCEIIRASDLRHTPHPVRLH